MLDRNFGWAIGHLWDGKRMFRESWNGKGQFICLQRPDEHSKMTLPYIYMETTKSSRVPWLASQADILAGDWNVFEE